jgi:hypothetical protein
MPKIDNITEARVTSCLPVCVNEPPLNVQIMKMQKKKNRAKGVSPTAVLWRLTTVNFPYTKK